MEQVFQAIQELIKQNAYHPKRGFRIRDSYPILTAGHMVSEAAEVLDSILFNESTEEIQYEMADTLACLVHLAIMLNVTPEQLTASCLHKLGIRFTTAKDARKDEPCLEW